jgi:hypothetical protein
MEFKKHKDKSANFIASMPFIYMMIVPSVIFDIFLEVYHNVCFRLYGIDIVPRENYIKIDRHNLNKLNPMQKINCAYCGYVNGLMAYGTKIAGETEKYWCGIKHDATEGFVAPDHHKDFDEYEKYI